MNCVTEFGYAKVNLFLDVLGKSDGFHQLDSVVCSLDLCDEVLISKRSDDEITLKTIGKIPLEIDKTQNNAYLAAKLFKQTFKTKGVDITIKKSIPIGAGLGGSSADIAAVLKGLKTLFEIDEDIKPLADRLSSDAGYQLSGGYSRMQGKGDKIQSLFIDKKLYFLIIVGEGGISTKECFFEFSLNPSKPIKQGANRLIEALRQDSLKPDMFYNALFGTAVKLNDNVFRIYNDLLKLNPLAVVMTGSGSGVVAIYEDMAMAENGKNQLIKSYSNVILSQTN